MQQHCYYSHRAVAGSIPPLRTASPGLAPAGPGCTLKPFPLTGHQLGMLPMQKNNFQVPSIPGQCCSCSTGFFYNYFFHL